MALAFFCLRFIAVKMENFTKYDFNRPRISFSESEKSEHVTLLCNVKLNGNIPTWKNVTYHVEWLRNGLRLTNDSLCMPSKPKDENDNPCPGENNLVARLEQKHFGYGDWVSFFY